jgi:chemotaxis protein CheD
MLPTCPIKPRANPSFAAGNRYVDYAIRNLARQFSAMGVLHSEVQVKLFGGGDVLDFATETMRPTVGRLNREVALRVLDEEGFKVSASRLGGTRGVKIQFHTGTGEVLLRLLG